MFILLWNLQLCERIYEIAEVGMLKAILYNCLIFNKQITYLFDNCTAIFLQYFVILSETFFLILNALNKKYEKFLQFLMKIVTEILAILTKINTVT